MRGLLNGAAIMQQQPLVILVAAHRPDLPPAEAVEWAIQLVAESVVQFPKLGKEIDRRRKEAAS